MTEQTSAEPDGVPVPQVLPVQDVLFVVTPELEEREIRRQRRLEADRARARRYQAEGRRPPSKPKHEQSTGVVDSAPVVEWVMRLIAREAGVLGFTKAPKVSKATQIVCERLGVPERTLFRWRMEGARIQLDILDRMLTRSEYLWWDVYCPHHGEAYIRVQEFFEG